MRRVPALVLHCDLDSFYASVEQAVRPELRGRPVAISAPRGQSVITAASYEAKRLGIRVGVPLREAYKRCPDLTFLPARMDAYQRVGHEVRQIVLGCCPVIETLGIDECFLNLRDVDPAVVGAPSDVSRTDRGPTGLAHLTGVWIREQVRERTGLGITVGVGSNKTVAKLASDSAKPDGLRIVATADELEFLRSALVEDVTGIGPRSVTKLHAIGIHTLGDMASMSRESLMALLGKRQGKVVYAMARNEFDEPVAANPAPKTTSAMRSFGPRGHDAHDALEDLLAEVLERLVATDRAARSIAVFAANETRVYQGRHDTKAPTKDVRELAASARRMAADIPTGFVANFAGVSLDGLSDTDQLRLGIEAGWIDDERFNAPVRPREKTTARRLELAAHYNMAVHHERFGAGRVMGLGRDTVLVRFPDRDRELELWAPIEY